MKYTFKNSVGSAILAASVMAASSFGNELTKFTTVCNTDFAAVGVGGMMQLGTCHLALTNAVPAGSVKKALLYWHGGIAVPAGTSANPDALLQNTTLNGVPIQGTGIGFSSDNGWATYVQASEGARADVTSIVNAGGTGTYTFTGVTNISGASLLVFFDDNNPANNRDVIIYDGNDSNSPNPYDADGWNVNLGGFIYGGGDARLQLHVSDGQSYQERDLLLNGVTFVPGPSVFTGTSVPAENNFGLFPPLLGLAANNTRLWDIATHDLAPWLVTGPNNLFFTTGIRQDFFSLVVAAIDVAAGSAVDCGAGAPPPSNNHVPSVNCNAPLIIEANMVSGLSTPKITADIRDEDGDSLFIIWKLDGNVISTLTIPGTPGTPLSTNLSLPLQLRPRQTEYRIDVTISDGTAAPVTCSDSITVKDPILPTVNCGSPSTVFAAPNGVGSMPDVNALITASDNVTPRELLAVTQVPLAGTPVIPGVYVVNVLVKDEAGNFSTCQKTILVADNPVTPNQPPTISCGPTITVTADAQGKSVIPNVVGAATAGDDFSPVSNLVLTQSPVAGSVASIGTYDIVVTVTDEGGKSSSCITKFIVQRPNQPPVVDCGADISVVEDASGNGTIPNVLSSITVTDDYTPVSSLVLTQSPAAGTVVPKGTYQIVVTAKDAAGLTASCTKIFVVKSKHIIPTVNCALGGGEMWPPNHRMVTIDFTATSVGTVGNLEVTVYSDEDDEEQCGSAPYPADEWDWDAGKNKGHGQGWGDGNFSPDTSMSNKGDLLLRSERRGDRDGRVYLVVVKGTSITGDTAYCVGSATVPHDQSAASRASVCAQAAAAIQYMQLHGTPPSHYVKVGDGPEIGKKNGPDENGNSSNSAKIFKQRDCCPQMILTF